MASKRFFGIALDSFCQHNQHLHQYKILTLHILYYLIHRNIDKNMVN